MDKVRFAIGTPHVFQGYHKKGENGMIGAHVYVTAHVLAEVVNHIQTDINTDEWNRVHNAPEPEMDRLCFGANGSKTDGGHRFASDGVTILYPLDTFEATIVQRYDETLPLRSGSGFMGRWVNEDAIDDFEPWADITPGTFKPVTHGFYIDPQMVAEGREDAPLIETYADREAAKADTAISDAEVAVAQATVIRSGDGMLPPGYYYDHDGMPTTDPRCELGLCITCINESLDRGEVPIIPSLSTHDPRYLTDEEGYRAAVVQALAMVGVTLREDVDNG